MHPTVVKINEDICNQFVREWKTDIIFADQLSNRWGDMDYNPKTGYAPHSYIQQLTDLAGRLKAIVPFGMEGGFDVQVPNAAIYYSLSWPMMGDPAGETDYNGRYGNDGWEWSPMFMYMAHDRVITSLHDLGDKVDNPQRLSTVLAHGYSIMSNIGDGNCDTLKDDSPELRWLWWLSAVQQNLCARYLGQELLDFRYVAPYVVAVKYPGLRMTINLTGTPYELKDEKVTLGPYGYWVVGDDSPLVAGRVTKAFGKTYPAGVSFIRRIDDGKVKYWLHGDKPEPLNLPDAKGTMRPVTVPAVAQKEAVILE